jgi:hypothetical protein
MVMGIINKVVTLAKHALHQINYSESHSMILGRIMVDKNKAKESIENLCDIEFKVFSQFGDDGIIQWLVHRLDIKEHTFIEFGVGDYRESNTRFLLMNNNWSGLVIDGSQTNVDRIIASEYYWQHNLTAKCAFVNTKNINELLSTPKLGPSLGLLHIDLDGNDYWILEELEMLPVILILEYNSVFGVDRAISVPYDPMFQRSRAHYSNLYYGASLPALHNLATSRGYAFVGCNSAGNNAYFVRRDRMMDPVREISLHQGFVSSKYRESRGLNGQLTYLTGDDRLQLIRGLPVINTTTGISEPL